MSISLTIGIEEEFQTIDPTTRNLRSPVQAQILEQGKMLLREESIKPELHQSVVEVGTSVCRNVKEAREQVRRLRRQIVDLAKAAGLRVTAAATHPFADWREQEIYPDARYQTIVEDLQAVARANLIFGLHVHIGVEDREAAIHLMNAAAEMNPNYRWLKTSGIISPEKWGNLPGGEVFSTPGEVNGIFVIDGVVGDYLCAKFGDLRAEPLSIEVRGNRLGPRPVRIGFWRTGSGVTPTPTGTATG